MQLTVNLLNTCALHFTIACRVPVLRCAVVTVQVNHSNVKDVMRQQILEQRPQMIPKLYPSHIYVSRFGVVTHVHVSWPGRFVAVADGSHAKDQSRMVAIFECFE